MEDYKARIEKLEREVIDLKKEIYGQYILMQELNDREAISLENIKSVHAVFKADILNTSEEVQACLRATIDKIPQELTAALKVFVQNELNGDENGKN